ncbi:hypothetical protein GALMADRAFT_277028 [Galerina marginata CBS 339.88]|uniref:T6SS Phospholipase effector Tle1-like catalytic domain-containing protein n=1 Tax=Galerina marginata (strain CBS 339.88) TaxID=685588 RepID=A0A067TEW3_GALM3|nr:hypothetical protein GALMADRAFT_277028 [Galerina marginata CBS 339.88]
MFIPERPADAKFRTLVVLLDGTGDSVDNDVTNIVHLKNMLYGTYKEDDKQMVLYLSIIPNKLQRGIGSPMDGFDPEFDDEKAHPWKSSVQRTWEQAFASDFGEYVARPYKWLAQNYKDGDKICIFGFSRGAYTARALAGMINAIGLLPKEASSETEVKAAYDLYDNFADLPRAKADREPKFVALMDEFQALKEKKKCREVFIEFLGCWDTVNSVGYQRAIKLGYTRTNDIVRTFRHAIALDEHRVKFKQNNWSGPPEDKVPNPADKATVGKPPRGTTDVEEVWFSGCHCDIGGGSVLNGTRPNLAHIPLRWMIRECFNKNNGMMFDPQAIKIIGIDPSSLSPGVKRSPPEISTFSSGFAKIAVVEPEGWVAYFKSWIWSKKGTELQLPNKSEDELDAADALAPAYDQLVLNPGKWALMERIGLKKDNLNDDGKWGEISEQHLSHGRTIPPLKELHGGKVKAHWTVRRRMECRFENGKTYVPLARVGYEKKYEDKTLFTKAVEDGWVEWVA